MIVKFSKLLEGTELTDEVRAALQESWDSSLAEAREEQSAELREEFAQRYDHDKGIISNAVDGFVTDKIKAEISELAEDRKELIKEKVRYRQSVKKNINILQQFILETVSKEVQELRKDRKQFSKHVENLDEFISEQLAEELSEFHNDKKSLVEQKVKMIKAGKKEIAEAKKKFIAYASKKVEKAVNSTLTNEMSTLREDITAARENDFGRKIFEAFVTEYGSSILNEGSEVQKMHQQIANVQASLRESNEKLRIQAAQTRNTKSKLRISEDKAIRTKKLGKLLSSLGSKKRELMTELLENTQTKNLERDFNKYIDSVLTDNTPSKRKTLTENARIKTSMRSGDKKAPVVTDDATTADEAEIVQIRKLAGLS